MMSIGEWISTIDDNHRQYRFSSHWGVNAVRGFSPYDSYTPTIQDGKVISIMMVVNVSLIHKMPNSSMSSEEIVRSLALTTLQFQQDTRASLQYLGNQLFQLATSINKLEGQASQQKVNPIENVSLMTPQSAKELQTIEQVLMKAKEDEKTLEDTEVQHEKVESDLIPPPSFNTCVLPFPYRMLKSKDLASQLRRFDLHIRRAHVLSEVKSSNRSLCCNRVHSEIRCDHALPPIRLCPIS
ncbi:UNVERIFIED_CONTAM: hypothetical protein Sradi_6663400 [Sesamum radiatum]|uniref:Uncharacterized protein n=1 Tax=Sesamum radiatum TaxID=300843 RepID=A0AAW2JPE1_SESRA